MPFVQPQGSHTLAGLDNVAAIQINELWIQPLYAKTLLNKSKMFLTLSAVL